MRKAREVAAYGEGRLDAIKRGLAVRMGNTVSDAVERLAHSSIYQPPEVHYSRRMLGFVQSREGDSIAMRLYSHDEQVVARFLGGRKAASENELCIFSHGNAGDIGQSHQFCQHLCVELGMDVLVYDYPQYGHSSATNASEGKLLTAIEAVFDECLRHGWRESRIMLLGHSLGSVPTLHVAAKPTCCVAGVVLLAPISSGARVLLHDSGYVPRWMKARLDCVLFDNLRRIADVRCPIAIVHGTEDSVVPAVHTELLMQNVAEGCQFPVLFLATGHNELVDVCSHELTRMTEYIGRFRDRCCGKYVPKSKIDNLICVL